jgi:hypothetical protein
MSHPDYGFLTFIHEPSFLRLLEIGKAPRSLTGSFAGDSSPACMHKANALFDESFPQIQAQTYEGYGAVELMVSVLFLPALAIVACTGVLLNRLVSDFNPRSHIRAC